MSTATDLLLTRAGISYRQLDYWVRQGYIHDRVRRRNGAEAEHRSIGYIRDIPVQEEPVLLLMGRLVNAGFKPETAARIARETEFHGEVGTHLLGPGLQLKIYGEAL